MKTPIKYTFEVDNPYRRDSGSHHQARCGADIYQNGPGTEQLGAAPYVTANGRVTPVAKYRADRVAAALTATQNMTPERYQATGLAGGEGRITGGICSCHSSGRCSTTPRPSRWSIRTRY
jgi:hypothetical protein